MNVKDYRSGRAEGMKLAYSIIKEGGIEALENELKFREKTKINTALAMKEIEAASKPMRGFINEVQILLWLSVLHDEFDFGKDRLNRAMDRFEQVHSAITDGYAGYCDYLELLQDKMKRVLKAEYIVKDDDFKKKEDK